MILKLTSFIMLNHVCIKNIFSGQPPLFTGEKPAVPQDILDIFGSQQSEISFAPPIPNEVAQLWDILLKRGLGTEERQILLNKYKVPNNCLSAIPPILNPEVKAAVNDVALSRDLRLEKVQVQMGASLAALGKAVSLLVSSSSEGRDQQRPLLEAISDGAKLLADIHHNQSVSRQNVIATNLDRNLKTVTENAELDGWLFGKDLSERIRNAKQIEKSGEELRGKPTTVKKSFANAKNVRTPPRKPPLGGPQFQRKPSFNTRVNRYQQRDQDRQYHYQRRTSGRARRQRY